MVRKTKYVMVVWFLYVWSGPMYYYKVSARTQHNLCGLNKLVCLNIYDLCLFIGTSVHDDVVTWILLFWFISSHIPYLWAFSLPNCLMAYQFSRSRFLLLQSGYRL